VNRRDLQKISKVRLREAAKLLDQGLPDGAYCLAGYAVECALKACIARHTARFDFPEKGRTIAAHTHSIVELIRVAGLEEQLRQHARTTERFRQNWEIVRLWSVESRYARHSLRAAAELCEAISEPRHGVATWLKRYW
jgi:HEPN domain-containing protein